MSSEWIHQWHSENTNTVNCRAIESHLSEKQINRTKCACVCVYEYLKTFRKMMRMCIRNTHWLVLQKNRANKMCIWREIYSRNWLMLLCRLVSPTTDEELAEWRLGEELPSESKGHLPAEFLLDWRCQFCSIKALNWLNEAHPHCKALPVKNLNNKFSKINALQKKERREISSHF